MLFLLFLCLHFTAWKTGSGFLSAKEWDCSLVHFIGLLSHIMNACFIITAFFQYTAYDFYVAGALLPELLFDPFLA